MKIEKAIATVEKVFSETYAQDDVSEHELTLLGTNDPFISFVISEDKDYLVSFTVSRDGGIFEARANETLFARYRTLLEWADFMHKVDNALKEIRLNEIERSINQ